MITFGNFMFAVYILALTSYIIADFLSLRTYSVLWGMVLPGTTIHPDLLYQISITTGAKLVALVTLVCALTLLGLYTALVPVFGWCGRVRRAYLDSSYSESSRATFGSSVGYAVEKMQPGSTIDNVAAFPPYVLKFVDSNQKFVGLGINTAFGVVVPKHVLLDSTHIFASELQGSAKVPNSSSIIDLYPDVSLVKVQFRMPVAEAKIGPVMGTTSVQVYGAKSASVPASSFGSVRPSEIFGMLEYSGSTMPGFSGSPYVYVNTVVGMHLGAQGDVNVGIAMELVKALYKHHHVSSLAMNCEDTDNYLQDLIEQGYDFPIASIPGQHGEGRIMAYVRGKFIVAQDSPKFDTLKEVSIGQLAKSDRKGFKRQFKSLADEYDPEGKKSNGWVATYQAPDDEIFMELADHTWTLRHGKDQKYCTYFTLPHPCHECQIGLATLDKQRVHLSQQHEDSACMVGMDRTKVYCQYCLQPYRHLHLDKMYPFWQYQKDEWQLLPLTDAAEFTGNPPPVVTQVAKPMLKLNGPKNPIPVLPQYAEPSKATGEVAAPVFRTDPKAVKQPPEKSLTPVKEVQTPSPNPAAVKQSLKDVLEPFTSRLERNENLLLTIARTLQIQLERMETTTGQKQRQWRSPPRSASQGKGKQKPKSSAPAGGGKPPPPGN